MAEIPIRMPKMSMTMTEGEVSEWMIDVGDEVNEGDVVCEVLTDKVDMEVESPATGVLTRIVVESGSVEVGTPIGYIDGETSTDLGDLLGDEPETAPEPEAASEPETAPEPEAPADVPAEASSPETAPAAEGATPAVSAGSAASASAGAATEPASTASASTSPAAGAAPAAVVPRARALALELGVDVTTVSGTGPHGLVLLGDVQAAAAAPAAAPAPPAPTAPTVAPRPAASSDQPGRAARAPSSKRVAQIRARVAAKMVESAAVPQFTLWRDLRLDDAQGRRHGVSWTTVLLASYAAALREVPELLCRWEGEAAVDSGPPSVGLAVATPHGLLAPVIAEPDRADPRTLDGELRALVRTAESGRVDAAYLGIANGMLSNLGSAGVDRFQALVTPPQGSVLSVGSVRPRPVAVPGGLGVALQVTVGLTVDHRIADGAHGAALLEALDTAVRTWETPA